MGVEDVWIEVGKVVGAFGVDGALKVSPHSTPRDSVLRKARVWRFRSNRSGDTDLRIRSVKPQIDSLVAVLAETITREQAMLLKGASVLVRRADFPPVEPGEFYWTDLIGCEVHNLQQVLLGRVTSVDDHGAGPLLNIDQRHLVPMVEPYLQELALDRRRIVVDWPEDWS